MKKIIFSIYRKKTEKKTKISVTLETSSVIKSNLKTQSTSRISLIVKQLITFVLTNYEKIWIFYPLEKNNIYIDFFIFLIIENFMK